MQQASRAYQIAELRFAQGASTHLELVDTRVQLEQALPVQVRAAPDLRIFSGNDANPWATMRAGGAGVISGRSAAYPEVYAALRGDPDVQ